MSDNEFVALDDNDDALGPAAVLLCGHTLEDGDLIGALLETTGLPNHRVVCCTRTMGTWTVEAALAGADEGPLLPVGPVPRIMLLSGLTDAQVQAVLDGFAATGLPRPIFAVATTANLGFTVLQLLEELVAERQALTTE